MEEYLKPGFNPRSLKVAQLRRILTQNNVEFPSHSKKALLVRLFEENISPQVTKLRTRSVTSLSNFSDEGVSTRSSTKTKSRKRRISIRSEEENEEEDEDSKEDISMSSGKQSSSSSGEETETKKLSKKRKRIGDENENSLITEKVAQKSPSRSPHRPIAIEKFDSTESSSESPSTSFSENKERSSPIDLRNLKVSNAYAEELERQIGTPLKTSIPKPEPSPMQKDIDGAEEEEKKLEDDVQSRVVEGTPTLVKSPDIKAEHPEVRNAQYTVEEVNVEEEVQQNYEQEDKILEEPQEEQQGSVEEVVALPNFWKYSFHLAIKSIYNLLIFSSIVLPLLYGLWYREARISIGYCGQELSSPMLPKQLRILPFSLPEPKCLSCPEHALCYPQMQLKCKPEYALKHNPWSLYGLLPLSDFCVKDSKRERLIGEIVDKSLQFLRVKNALVSCGESSEDMKCGVLEDELYQIFYESKTPWINDEEFDDLWIQAVKNLKNDPEITWRQVSNINFLQDFESFMRTFDTNSDKFWQPSENEYRILRESEDKHETNDFSRKERHFPEAENETGIFRSTSKKYIGIKCKFENEIYQACYRNRKFIVPFLLGIVIGKFLLSFNRKLRQETLKVDRLTRKVINRLKNAKRSEEGESPFLSTVQLRDVLLSDVVDLRYKNHLWDKISKILEHNNTNIKSNLMEIHGEIMKCWEWIGPLEEET